MVRLCRQPDGFSAVRGAYRFLSLLGDEILEIAEDHILTKQKENYQLLMWNYCDYTEAFAKGDRSSLSLLDRDGAFDAKPACVRANVPLQGHYLQTVYTLDKSTSAFHNWVRMGAPIYACYHLLECSCGTLKRGNFDHYEYLMYFNGANNAATKFVLKDWQIKELGLSHT